MIDIQKHCAKISGEIKYPKPRKLILSNDQSPGDVILLTATIRDIHKAYPGQFFIDCHTPCPALFENNPHITKLNKNDPEVEYFAIKDYNLINSSNQWAYHFIHCFHFHLEQELGIRIPCTELKADIHISDSEKSWFSQIEELGIKDDFWIITPGGKYDFTCKWMNPDYLQEVIDYFYGKITFVQCGSQDHWHPKLKGTIDLIGKTDLRQLVRLVYHSVGVLCPVTFAMHLAAATPTKEGRPLNRACVVIAGGREPVQWEAYPHHRYLAVNGSLSCCDNGGCWKSRCTLIKDHDDKNKENTCLFPITVEPKVPYPKERIDGDLKIPQCIMMIEPRDIIRAIEWYYNGDLLKYGSSIDKIETLARKTK